MNFAFDEEQEELRRVVRRFLEEQSPADRVREVMEDDQPYDREVWTQMAGQLGLQALAIPEEHGAPVRVPRAHGRSSRRSDAPALRARTSRPSGSRPRSCCSSGDETAQKEYLPAIALGDLTATLAMAEDRGAGTEDIGLTAAATTAGGA